MPEIYQPCQADFFINLGLKIKQQRLSLGLSRSEFSKLTRIQAAYLSEIERGQKNISFIFLLRIAKSLGLSPEKLVSNL